MNIVDNAKEWLVTVALKKAVKKGVQALIAVLVGVKVAGVLKQLGIEIDPMQLEAGLTLFAMAGIEFARNFLKQKFGLAWL